jgi:hypothetical protein
MKTSLVICLLTAVLFMMSSTEPAAVMANSTGQSQSRCGSVTSALPHPFLHLRVLGDAMVLEIGCRPPNARTAPACQSAELRLTVAQSGKVEFLLHAQNLWLVVPLRSA